MSKTKGRRTIPHPCECKIPNGGYCERHEVWKHAKWVALCRTDMNYFTAWENGKGPGQPLDSTLEAVKPAKPKKPKNPKKPKKEILLGDAIAKALETVGITKDRVSKWLGRPCKCGERQRRLNQLHLWAKRVLSGKTENAEEYLEEIVGGSPDLSTDD